MPISQVTNAVSHSTNVTNVLNSTRKCFSSLLSKVRSASKLERTPEVDTLVKTATETGSSIDRLNIVKIDNPDKFADIAKETFKNRKYRIATSGYSSNPEGYKEVTEKFLQKLDKKLGKKNTAYIAPPELEDGNIYDITAKISGLEKDKLMFITSDRYMKFLHPENFPKHVNMKKYEKMPIYSFPTIEGYVEGTAKASNTLVCTGGRKVAVDEIVNAIKNGNKVVVLINENLKNKGYNKAEGYVDNAAQYFIEQIKTWGDDKNPYVRDMTLDFLTKNENKIKTLSRVYITDGSEKAIEDAADRAARFLEAPTMYDYAEKYGWDLSRYGM